MKTSSAKKNMNQALSLNSRNLTRKKLPKLPLRSFDGWFTATEGVTKNLLNNPNTVSGWKNLVPGGSDFAQSTSNLQPALTTINGLTALAPDGASGRGAATDVLVEGDMIDNIGTGDFYIAFVISLDALTVASYAILSKGGTGSYNIEIGGNSKNLAIRVGSSVVFQTDTDSFTETNETYFVEVVRTDGTTICYKNGENIKELTPIYTLAAEGDLSFGRADCKVGEFICKKGTMPDRTRQVIEALMATKWNLGANPTAFARKRAAGFNSLPVVNQFRNRPPTF
jgi:hypothetical protein